jgi:hypothetical protein
LYHPTFLLDEGNFCNDLALGTRKTYHFNLSLLSNADTTFVQDQTFGFVQGFRISWSDQFD